MKKIAFLVVALFCVNFLFAQDTIVFIKNDGVKLYQAQKYPEAIKKFEEALALSPNNGDILYKIGLCAFKAEEFDKAVKSYKDALAQDYKPKDCYKNIAIIYQTQSDYVNMRETLEQGLAVFAGDAGLKGLAPGCYMMLAKEEYDKGVEFQKSLLPIRESEPDKYKVEVEKANDMFKNALDIAKKGYDIDPTDKNVLNVMITVCTAMGDEASAKKYDAELKALGE